MAIDCIGWPAELARIRRWYEPLLDQHHEDASARRPHAARANRRRVRTAWAIPDRADARSAGCDAARPTRHCSMRTT